MGGLVAISLLCALIGYLLLKDLGRGTLGFLSGCLLGPIGIVIALIDRSTRTRELTRECPFCAERIQTRATVCRFCAREIAPLAVTQNGTESGAR